MKEGMGDKPQEGFTQRRCHNCGMRWWEEKQTTRKFCPHCREEDKGLAELDRILQENS